MHIGGASWSPGHERDQTDDSADQIHDGARIHQVHGTPHGLGSALCRGRAREHLMHPTLARLGTPPMAPHMLLRSDVGDRIEPNSSRLLAGLLQRRQGHQHSRSSDRRSAYSSATG